jgi:hypothetical protein
MKQTGMSLANVIGVAPSEESVYHIAAQPEVESIVYFTFGVADQGYAGLHGKQIQRTLAYRAVQRTLAYRAVQRTLAYRAFDLYLRICLP